MTYTIYWMPSQSRNLTMHDVLKADTLNAGMLEQVLPNLISWHDIKANDLSRALDYIALEYGNILVSIEEEHYIGCMCNGKFICAMQLSVAVNNCSMRLH